MKQYWKYIAILACGLLLGFLLSVANIPKEKTKLKEETSPPQSAAWLIIEINEGEGGAWRVEPEKEKSLLQNMETLVSEKKIKMKTKEFPGLGIMIEELEGRKNGEEGKYWQYWINEKYAKVGAGAYIPQGGDIVEWRLTNQQNF